MKTLVYFLFITSFFISSCTFDPQGLQNQIDSSVNNNNDADTDINNDITEDIQDSDIQDIQDGDTQDNQDGDITCTSEDTSCLDYDNLQICNSSGQLTTINCEYGCNPQTDPHSCLDFIPSNGLNLDVLLNPDLSTISFGQNTTLNSDNGEIIIDETIFRTAGEGLDLATGIHFAIHQLSDGSTAGVFSFNIMNVNEGITIDIIGTNSVIFRTNSTFIKGLVDISASPHKCGSQNNRCSGPGGFNGGSANNSGNGPGAGSRGDKTWGIGDETGGGGAGYSTAGAKGGGDGGGDGGPDYGNPQCEPLLGGSGGGGGGHIDGVGSTDSNQARGGGGGGALQITARNYLELGNATGEPCGINANGAGGSGIDYGMNSGGGGAGAGGAVILESPRIRIYSNVVISANGGGGGAGRENHAGSEGLFSQEAAPGGNCDGCNRGGNGASEQNPNPERGQTNEGGDGSGGGGGALGRIMIYDCIDYLSDGIFSPQPTLGGCRL